MDGTLVDVKICIKSLFTVARIKQRYRFQIDQANSVGAKTTKRRAHHHRVEGCRVVHLIYAFDARREQALKSDTESQNGNWTNDEKSYGDKLQCTAANRSTTLLKSPRVGSKTRPDTRLPKSLAGGQGPYLRSPDHLGRSSEVEKIKS